MSQQVLHLDFIALAPETTAEQRRQLEDAAASLLALDQVIAAGVIEGERDSDFDVVFYFLLPDFAALEPFGTDPRYSRFLQGSVAPVLKAFAGADIRLDAGFESADSGAACVALAAPDETFDWEVREALEAWSEALSPDALALGVAVGERQRYRGAAIVFGGDASTAARPQGGKFAVTLVAGRARRLYEG